MDSSVLSRIVDFRASAQHSDRIGTGINLRSTTSRQFKLLPDEAGVRQAYFEPYAEEVDTQEDVLGALIATVPRQAASADIDHHGGLAALDVHEHTPQRPFCIRAANTAGQRSSASVLVSKMYSWRGYQTSASSESRSANRLTLVASDHEHATVGTITIGFDSTSGLLVDDLFAEEVDALRNDGLSVCEFTKLAIDGVIRSKRLLASMFHVAYLFAHRVEHSDHLLIEVNPRHVRYYEKVLGFTVLGPQRLNRRVNAPAVLLCLELAHAREQIARFAGQAESAVGEKSLYPYFFSPAEEAGILARIARQ